MKEEFYVENVARGCVGNSMLWWEKNSRGYVCDIRKAKVFNVLEIEKMDSIKQGDKRAWPKQYIDERISHHIDMQHCDFEQAKKGADNG